MTAARTAGRTLGLLLLVQSMAGITANFVLLAPAISAPPGFLVNAAGSSTQIIVAVLLLLGTGLISLANAITAMPVIRRHSAAMAVAFVALAAVNFSGVVVEGIALRAMLALSQEFARTGAADPAAFETLSTLARAVRNSAHYTNLLLGGCALLVFYIALFRFKLVPRALAALGLLTVTSLIAGALVPLFGYPTVMLMFMPMGLSHLALALWLVVRGFAETDGPVPTR